MRHKQRDGERQEGGNGEQRRKTRQGVVRSQMKENRAVVGRVERWDIKRGGLRIARQIKR